MDALLSPRRRTVLQALGAATLLAACGERRPPSSAVHEFRGPSMGSAYALKVASRPMRTADANAAHDAVRAALAGVEDAMSSYRTDSELSRLNGHPAGAPFALTEDTFAVLALAQRVAADTGGAFDVTVAPVVDAWGFGPARNRRVVAGDEIAALSRDVGARLLSLDAQRRTATKARDGVRADLSGVAKGFAVDKAARALDAIGVGHYMIEAGGEVRTRGTNGDGEPWRIAIEQPDAVPQRAHLVVPLTGLSMATSGDYRIFFERDGRRYCHEIDPATGRPIDNGLASVTVVHEACGYADAMATALIVMGAQRGLAFAAERGIAAYFIVREGAALVPRATPAFRALGGTLVA